MHVRYIGLIYITVLYIPAHKDFPLNSMELALQDIWYRVRILGKDLLYCSALSVTPAVLFGKHKRAAANHNCPPRCAGSLRNHNRSIKAITLIYRLLLKMLDAMSGLEEKLPKAILNISQNLFSTSKCSLHIFINTSHTNSWKVYLFRSQAAQPLWDGGFWDLKSPQK